MGDIDKLAGSYEFRKQVAEGKTAEEIRNSWEPGIKISCGATLNKYADFGNIIISQSISPKYSSVPDK
jgi:hypothetical protein